MSAQKPKAQPETWEDPYRKPRSYRWLVFLLMLPVLYILSMGPAMWLCARAVDAGKQRTAEMIMESYVPLVQVAYYTNSLRALNWYVALWVAGDDRWQFHP